MDSQGSWNNVIALLLKACPWSLLEMHSLGPKPRLTSLNMDFKKIPTEFGEALFIPGPQSSPLSFCSLLLLYASPCSLCPIVPLPHWSSFSPSCLSVSSSQTPGPGTYSSQGLGCSSHDLFVFAWLQTSTQLLFLKEGLPDFQIL